VGLLLDTLSSASLLSEAQPEAIVRFMVLGKSADYPKGHVFWRVGTPPQGLLIPVSGEAKSVTLNDEGREFIDRLSGTGECLGMESAIDGGPHLTTVQAVRSGEFFTISRACFRQFLDEYSDIERAVVRDLCRGIRINVQGRSDIALRPVSERIARLLVEHACLRQEDGARVLLDATQAEIAARVGTVREVVARVFSQFTDRGLLERTSHGIFIADWDGLCAEAAMVPEGTGEPTRGSGSRTARFFLSASERRKLRRSHDPQMCKEHLRDLSICRQKGCNAADGK